MKFDIRDFKSSCIQYANVLTNILLLLYLNSKLNM